MSKNRNIKKENIYKYKSATKKFDLVKVKYSIHKIGIVCPTTSSITISLASISLNSFFRFWIA